MRFRYSGRISAGLMVAAGLTLWAQELLVRSVNGKLRIVAPKLHFLAGEPLARLQNGAAVPFDFQLSLLTDNKGTILERVLERFIVSYDLWEEKFSVVRVRGGRKSVSHLAALAAEAWCLENLEPSSERLGPDQVFWVRLDVRAEEPRHPAPWSEDPGISLAALIEVFSRPVRGPQSHSAYEAGPLRLRDLR